MRIGVPKEVKNHEYRVAVTPAGVHELVAHGHEVVIEKGAGSGSSISDEEYSAAGAQVLATAENVWSTAELILKVKEPIREEYDRMREGQVLFTYLHLAADKALTEELLARKVTAIAYETVQTDQGGLPLLSPMSEVAGRIAPQVGAATLLRSAGGRGVLLGGVPGVLPAEVVIIGGGVSGQHATRIAVGMGAQVTVLDKDPHVLKAIDKEYHGRVRTLASNAFTIEQACLSADLVIGAVLIPGSKAPTLVSNDLVKRMKVGSVLVDISIDQGGCFEDSRATTHAEPTYTVHGSVFYCVANMPGAVAHTSTHALTSVTLPYTVALADNGWQEALRADAQIARGLNTHDGLLTNAPVGTALGLDSVEVTSLL
ncbi:alanine dehydrogenase [Spinactinospora alkalitolerans]|uniref:Alanine dehydrogenase n=1 Tax=Spinactinospora alkalitolerans TaxID=687207 RepID=A0A852U6F4_9ACTN|nr:alanine dehydrogenase [Spinactinospora alkalitolerans]NYE50453.1 alanine dehydrogenase [Spinactinospora alkalitolerans]